MRHALIVGAVLLVASCSSAGLGSPATTTPRTSAEPAVLETVATRSPPTTLAATEPDAVPATQVPMTVATTLPTTLEASSSLPATSTTAGQGSGTPYGMPVEDASRAGYAHEHHDYPASDIFAGGCGTTIIAPVNGVVLEVRREDQWTEETDNPATRGGKSISILGDDGVRYYFAHFESIGDGIAPGGRIGMGDHLGAIGMTGRAGACHLHFALSPPCPGKEWSVRRGVIWPWPYLDAWAEGRQLSPADETAQWLADHAGACAEAMADPLAGDS